MKPTGRKACLPLCYTFTVEHADSGLYYNCCISRVNISQQSSYFIVGLILLPVAGLPVMRSVHSTARELYTQQHITTRMTTLQHPRQPDITFGQLKLSLKTFMLVSWAAVPRVWTLRALTRNLLTYLLTTRTRSLQQPRRRQIRSDLQSVSTVGIRTTFNI